MTKTFPTLLSRYGQMVHLHGEGAQEDTLCMAFLQAVPDRREEQRVPTPLGLAWQKRFLYLGHPGGDLNALGDKGYISWKGGRYRVRTAHLVYVGQQANHWWAMLEPMEEAQV